MKFIKLIIEVDGKDSSDKWNYTLKMEEIFHIFFTRFFLSA